MTRSGVYLARNNIITLQSQGDWAPINYYEDGEPKGLSIEFAEDADEKKPAWNHGFVYGKSWNDYVEMVKHDQLDVLLNVVRTPERTNTLLFSEPYATLNYQVYTRKGTPPINSLADLQGKIIAVPKGVYYSENLDSLDTIRILSVSSSTDALRAVADGRADAFYELAPVVDWLMKKHGIENVQYGGDAKIGERTALQVRMAVNKKNKLLASILDKGMSMIGDGELAYLQRRWLGGSETESTIPLTQVEREYLRDKENILVAAHTEFPPFEYQNEKGQLRGISIDIFRLIAKRLGISTVEVIRPWPDLKKMLRNGKLDVSPEHDVHGAGAGGFFIHQAVRLVLCGPLTREGTNQVNSSKDLKGKTVAVEKDFSFPTF